MLDFMNHAKTWLRVFVIPLLVAIIVSIIFSVPEQILEYYRVLLEDLSYRPWIDSLRNLVFAVLCLFIIAASIAATARALEVKYAKPFGEDREWSLAYEWSPWVI